MVGQRVRFRSGGHANAVGTIRDYASGYYTVKLEGKKGATVQCTPAAVELCAAAGEREPSAAKRDGGAAAQAETVHLRQRQAERGISREELEVAMRDGEEDIRPGGSVHYKHRGVVYITKDGVGITAWRVELGPCTCHTNAASAAAADARDESFVNGRVTNSRMARFAIGMLNHVVKHHEQADQAEPLAEYLEGIRWHDPGNRNLMSLECVRKLLLIAAAGSLLNPVRCSHCHGVTGFRRCQNPLDENETVLWIRYLLGIKQVHGYSADDRDFLRVDARDVQSAAGSTALGAAAKAGHFRCSLELLRFGANIDDAFHDMHGPCANYHTICVMKLHAQNPKEYVDKCQAASYVDILSMFACAEATGGYQHYGDDELELLPELIQNPQVVAVVKMIISGKIGSTPGPTFATDLRLADVGFEFRLEPGGPKHKIGLVWDGHCWRFLLKPAPCGCHSPRCVRQGQSYPMAMGFVMMPTPRGLALAMWTRDDDLDNPNLREFVAKQEQRRAGNCMWTDPKDLMGIASHQGPWCHNQGVCPVVSRTFRATVGTDGWPK
jgi:hypothetical protein